MEDIDERYENGVIYMIKHKTDDKKEYYIGSTKDFKRRCRKHKSICNNQNSKHYNYKVYKYIRENGGWDEWEIILLYDYPCKNRNELELEEKRAVKEYKSTLNQVIPSRTRKEHYEANKEKILQQKAMKINCDICNSLVRKGDITRHKRTQKCKNSHK